MRKFSNTAQSVLEYIIAGMFLYGTYKLIGLEAIEPTGVFVAIFGGQVALYIYMVWFAYVGLALIYAKIRSRKKLHKNILLAMYLTAAYTGTLSIAFYGFQPLELIDNLVVGVLCAVFWIRWKFRTEYLDPKEWDDHRYDLDKPIEP